MDDVGNHLFFWELVLLGDDSINLFVLIDPDPMQQRY